MLFKAFAGGEDDLVASKQRRDVGDDSAEMLRGRDAEEDVGLEDGSGKIGGDFDVDGEGKAGEVWQIFSGVGELLGERSGVRPEEELVASAACQR